MARRNLRCVLVYNLPPATARFQRLRCRLCSVDPSTLLVLPNLATATTRLRSEPTVRLPRSHLHLPRISPRRTRSSRFSQTRPAPTISQCHLTLGGAQAPAVLIHFMPSLNQANHQGLKPSSFAYGQPPAQSPAVQKKTPQSRSEPAIAFQQYVRTGAPSVKDLLGNQGTPPSALSNRFAPTSPFRPAQFNAQDPKDRPLAPIVPSSILDGNDKRLDLPPIANPSIQSPVAPPRVELVPAEAEPELEFQPPSCPTVAAAGQPKRHS